MGTTVMNWPAVYPELLLLTMACVIALVDLFVTERKEIESSFRLGDLRD